MRGICSAVLEGEDEEDEEGLFDQGDGEVRQRASMRRPFSILVTRRQVISRPMPLTPEGLPKERRERVRNTGASQRTQRKNVR